MDASEKYRLAALAATALALLSGCPSRNSAPSDTTTPVAERPRFPHVRHTELGCTECHASDAVLEGKPAMPGADDHAPCDRRECHQAAFFNVPGPLCTICHANVDPSRTGASPLSPYPPTAGRRALASLFAHNKHLDFSLMEKRVGFHVTCADCHTLEGDDTIIRPDHSVCGRCHAPEAARVKMPAMDACDACHAPRKIQPTRTRRFIVGDLRFRHGKHLEDRRGVWVRCVECHVDTRSVRSISDHSPMTTEVCVECHDDFDRTPSSKRMRVCQTCHTAREGSFEVLAPRSHLPGIERPEDHTLAFRRGHGSDAQNNPARCARCHTFMSGAPRDVCDECHQVMRPHDHGLTWREFDHGPEASAGADTCATCHKGTFCSSCHSVMPRSHLPRFEFRDGGHALPAKLNIRACLTCHAPDTGCTGTGCHTIRGGL